jgi:hypothetical protein
MVILKFPAVVLSFFCLISSAASAQGVSNRAEEIAQTHYHKKALVSLLYDRDQDYRSAFNCESVLIEKPNDDGGIDATCITKEDVLWISTSMGPNRRLDSAYVCPTKQMGDIVSDLIEMAYDSKSISRGTVYNMGVTDGWLRDFVNRFVVMNIDDTQLSCWDIGRR